MENNFDRYISTELDDLPIIILGAFLGIQLVKNIPERAYRWFIISMTLIAAVFMLL